MRKFIRVIIVLIMIIGIVGFTDTKNISAKEKNAISYDEIKKNENIVFLGDSITDWYPIDEIFGDLPIVKSGVAGYKTYDILDRMDEMVYRYNPTKVILLIGTNDLNNPDLSRDEIVERIEKIFTDIHKNRKNTKLYYQSIYPVNDEPENSSAQNRSNEDIKYVNNELKKFCKQNNITYIDMYDVLKNSDDKFSLDYTNDGLHPNDLGYARISAELLKYIYFED